MTDDPFGTNGEDDRRESPPGAAEAPPTERDTPTSSAETDRIPMNLSRDDSDPTTTDPGDDENDETDPYAPEPGSARIEAGEPTLENVVFVLVGAVAMVLVIAHVVSLPL
ncbi:DUF7312 domain-containing protein [Natronobacterium gregoryi]|uniref:DUF7312 domain-containing protein n=2 Tax=Natronobacterium gregoryi TaxID=44930 RepID=L0AFH7_NATGS|nr:hypothetical protein [Natronobacterium gregoryi]AFZ71902.1 hypothetical protein Natgr_0654 [Natronobacterium gregoryi SP2]ELY62477.1 hypothetical protein C490_17983 [Natronobacterium gregoryi SP2]PLK20686.1 hypothetical protein CYV19_07975 [Natronobacterium gregoryi SP2]SFJ14398.1 hypothetical protein SAMN05443661_11567 [Natronobacterium gregoryi]